MKKTLTVFLLMFSAFASSVAYSNEIKLTDEESLGYARACYSAIALGNEKSLTKGGGFKYAPSKILEVGSFGATIQARISVEHTFVSGENEGWSKPVVRTESVRYTCITSRVSKGTFPRVDAYSKQVEGLINIYVFNIQTPINCVWSRVIPGMKSEKIESYSKITYKRELDDFKSTECWHVTAPGVHVARKYFLRHLE